MKSFISTGAIWTIITEKIFETIGARGKSVKAFSIDFSEIAVIFLARH
jgi:hypothetical protein